MGNGRENLRRNSKFVNQKHIFKLLFCKGCPGRTLAIGVYNIEFMARQDITMDAEYGEVETSGNIAGKTFYECRLLDSVEGADNDNYRYCEIVVPAGFMQSYSDSKGIHIVLPYTPDRRFLSIVIVKPLGSGGTEFLRNSVSGSIWFPVMVESTSGNSAITLAELYSLNEDGIFNLLLRDGYLAIFSGEETDFEIGAAKAQNETFLLKASAGNNYQHPTTGVGLIDFLHSSLENNGLAAKLQSEFLSDKMIIKNAYMDSVTGELLLETVEKEDNNG